MFHFMKNMVMTAVMFGIVFAQSPILRVKQIGEWKTPEYWWKAQETVELQKFLAEDVDAPALKNNNFDSWRDDILEMEVEALVVARDIDIDMAEAIMRVEIGSKVSDLSSKELKRDLLLYAKRNPVLFLELVNDDNVELRNFGIKATELGIIKLSQDQRTFSWGTNNRKLMNVPFDEHPYTALAHWFKTDEGMEIYSNIEKQLQ